jgi:T5SS/PEP-CTERM-associated repeat protein
MKKRVLFFLLGSLMFSAVGYTEPLTSYDGDSNLTIESSDSFQNYILNIGNVLSGIQFIVNPGITLTTDKIVIGNASSGNNVLVSGSGVKIYSPGTVESTFHLGYFGSNNTVTISNGGQVIMDAPGPGGHDALIGFYTGSNNNQMIVTGVGSLFSNDATFYIGRLGNNNSLLIENGGQVDSYNARIGGGCTATECNPLNTTNPSSNSATVTGAGSVWNISGKLRLGGGQTTSSNSNILTISNGGVVNLIPANNAYSGMWIGYDNSSNDNSLLITGRGSSLNAPSEIITVGGSGNSITLSDYGSLKAPAIYYTGSNGSLNLNRGAIIIAPSIISLSPTNTFNINLGAGASYSFATSGFTVQDLNGRPMVTGSAHAAGVGNITTASQSLYERTSQITQSLDDRVRTYDAKQNTSQDFWINTYYSDSNRGGQGLSGSNLSFNQYRSGITAGFNVKNSYTPTELIVNYEHGKLNIDEGNQGITSNSVMAGALFPDIKKLFTGTLSAKALVGYSDFSGDRKVLTNDVAFNGSRNVTANYQSSNLTIGSAWTKTLYQTDKMILDTLVGIDLNTQHINSYSESDLFKWNGRTINQLQERVTLGMEIKPLVKPLTLFGRVGVERRDLISGENQNYAINNTAVSYNDSNQRNTYATLNAGAYYPLTPTVKAYAQVRYYDSVKDIDSLSGSIGISGQF